MTSAYNATISVSSVSEHSQIRPVYSSLMESTQDVRVLDLFPGRFDDQIECHLEVVSLLDKPQYEALSYVWGDPSPSHNILINGSTVRVTSSLDTALRFLRHQDVSRRLWVDAVCINQQDKVEKGTQVNLMGEIYRNSASGAIWLGRLDGYEFEEEDVELCFNMIRQLAAHRLELENGDFTAEELKFGSRFSQVVEALVNNQWWTRIWTVQEAVLSPNSTIYWGTKSMPWSALAETGELISSWHMTGVKVPHMPKVLQGYNLTNAVTGITMYHNRNEESPTDKTPLEVFYRFRYRQATNPVDKIFALLGFLSDKEKSDLSLTADYSLSVQQLYQNITLGLITSLGSLRPLIGRRGEVKQTDGLLNWAVDWVAASPISKSQYWEHLFRYDWYSCDAGADLIVQAGLDNSTITVQGYKLDTIVTVAEPCLQDFSGEDLSTSKVISKIKAWESFLQLDQTGENDYIGGGTVKDAFWKTLTGGLITRSAHPYRRVVAEDRAAFDRFCSIEHNTVCSCEIYETIRIMLTNQTLFKTKEGYLGIGPSDLKVDSDEVWVVAGSRNPLILRPLAEGTEDAKASTRSLSFVADAYVHGIMQGEYWNACGGDDKLQPVILH